MKGNVWCVQYRSGWCAAMDQTKRPDASATSIPTLCACFIILTTGVEKRKPDCVECLAELKGKTS